MENFDLTIRPPKKKNNAIKYNRPIDPRLPCSGGKPCLMLFIGIPRSGKTTTLLNYLGSSQFTRGLYDRLIFIGASIKSDPTLKKLIEHYGEENSYDYLNDDLLHTIMNYQMQQPDDEKRSLGIIIDDALSLPNFEKKGVLTRLAGNHRHLLKGVRGPGTLIISTQKFIGSVPTSLRICANCFIIFKISGEQRDKIIENFQGQFGGKKQFTAIMNYCLNKKYNCMCVYIDGNSIIEDPCIYKNWSELVYPTARFPEKNVMDLEE